MEEKNCEKEKSIIQKNEKAAKEILNDPNKLDEFLQKLEDKMLSVPLLGDKLSNVVVMASMVKSYAKKEYKELPTGTVVAVVAALIYYVSPVDLIPDGIPIIGHADDIAVSSFCFKCLDSDVEKYVKWRKENGKEIDFECNQA